MGLKSIFIYQSIELELNAMGNAGTLAIPSSPKHQTIISKSFFWPNQRGYIFSSSGGFEIIETPEDVLETIEKAKNGFKPKAERGFIKIDNMKPFIIDGNLYHFEEPKMTVWNGLELWGAGTSYFLSK